MRPKRITWKTEFKIEVCVACNELAKFYKKMLELVWTKWASLQLIELDYLEVGEIFLKKRIFKGFSSFLIQGMCEW